MFIHQVCWAASKRLLGTMAWDSNLDDDQELLRGIRSNWNAPRNCPIYLPGKCPARPVPDLPCEPATPQMVVPEAEQGMGPMVVVEVAVAALLEAALGLTQSNLVIHAGRSGQIMACLSRSFTL